MQPFLELGVVNRFGVFGDLRGCGVSRSLIVLGTCIIRGGEVSGLVLGSWALLRRSVVIALVFGNLRGDLALALARATGREQERSAERKHGAERAAENEE